MPSTDPVPGRRIAGCIVEVLSEPAGKARVAEVRIGLGYTAVQLEDGGTGVAYTFHREAQGGCSVFNGLRPISGRPATDLLPLIESSDPIEAAVGLACANALANRHDATHQHGDILEQLDLRPDDQVAMVGQFRPLIAPLQRRSSSLTVFEKVPAPRGFLRPAEEAEDHLPCCQVALITATSIINHTIDGLLDAARGCRVVAVLGASTPMLPEVFSSTAVNMLSGVVVEQPLEIMRVVSEGGGMRQFKGSICKVNLTVGGE